ncbi:MAG: type II toxin-antitoxin system RelE/ParE family toxin [Clostridia bacterium]|nr:type II toxin-antitoxin system RelE/ParE family toxin [Clostridia bacterium]
MTREFVYTKPFLLSWAKMGLDDDDLKQLEELLLANPLSGDVMQGTGGARKLRIQLEGRGKRGGGRVIYLDVFEKEKLYLLLAYPKNVQDNLTSVQEKFIKDLVERLKKE